MESTIYLETSCGRFVRVSDPGIGGVVGLNEVAVTNGCADFLTQFLVLGSLLVEYPYALK